MQILGWRQQLSTRGPRNHNRRGWRLTVFGVAHIFGHVHDSRAGKEAQTEPFACQRLLIADRDQGCSGQVFRWIDAKTRHILLSVSVSQA